MKTFLLTIFVCFLFTQAFGFNVQRSDGINNLGGLSVLNNTTHTLSLSYTGSYVRQGDGYAVHGVNSAGVIGNVLPGQTYSIFNTEPSETVGWSYGVDLTFYVGIESVNYHIEGGISDAFGATLILTDTPLESDCRTNQTIILANNSPIAVAAFLTNAKGQDAIGGSPNYYILQSGEVTKIEPLMPCDEYPWTVRYGKVPPLLDMNQDYTTNDLILTTNEAVHQDTNGLYITNQIVLTQTNSIPSETNLDGSISPNLPIGTFNPTNNPNILWSATDESGVLKQGFQTLYDSQTKNGQTAHSDSSQVKAAVTSGTAQIVSAINGIGRSGTGTNTIIVNASGASNVWVQNFPTNFGSVHLDGTNFSLGLTNYASETTLEGISNLLAKQSNYTNNGDTNIEYQAHLGEQSASAGSNQLAGIFHQSDPINNEASYGSGIGSSWLITIPYGRGYSMDLNPFHVGWVSDLAAFVRSFLKWGMILTLIASNCDSVLKAISASGSARQAQTAGAAGIFSQLPLANTGVAIVCASLITLCIAALPAFAASYLVHYASMIGSDPFSGLSGALAVSVWISDQFIPLATLVSCSVTYVVFPMLLSAVVWGINTVIRFIVG